MTTGHWPVNDRQPFNDWPLTTDLTWIIINNYNSSDTAERSKWSNGKFEKSPTLNARSSAISSSAWVMTGRSFSSFLVGCFILNLIWNPQRQRSISSSGRFGSSHRWCTVLDTLGQSRAKENEAQVFETWKCREFQKIKRSLFCKWTHDCLDSSLRFTPCSHIASQPQTSRCAKAQKSIFKTKKLCQVLKRRDK